MVSFNDIKYDVLKCLMEQMVQYQIVFYLDVFNFDEIICNQKFKDLRARVLH